MDKSYLSNFPTSMLSREDKELYDNTSLLTDIFTDFSFGKEEAERLEAILKAAYPTASASASAPAPAPALPVPVPAPAAPPAPPSAPSAPVPAPAPPVPVPAPPVRLPANNYNTNDAFEQVKNLLEAMFGDGYKNKVIFNFPFREPVKVSAGGSVPAYQKIIDEIMLGNNIYLVGGAGTGKTYLAQQIAGSMGREIETINCSQWTTPTEIIGGQSLEGYVEGKMIEAWKRGKVQILDEMPKLDPNTAGLLNEALAKTGDRLIFIKDIDEAKDIISSALSDDFAKKIIKKVGSVSGEVIYLEIEIECLEVFKGLKDREKFQKIDALMPKLFTYPTLQNSRKERYLKHPNFAVIGTGNIYPNSEDMAYGANNKQDLSLLDRFAGSVYYIQKNPEFEKQLINNLLVWSVCDGLRSAIETNKYESQVSIRLMQTAKKVYDIEMERVNGKSNSLQANEGVTLKDVIDSFIHAGFTDNQTTNLKSSIRYDDVFGGFQYRKLNKEKSI